MQPEDRDAALLWDMLTAAKDIEEFARGATFVKFQKDKMLRYAVERQILALGEAANRISDKFKQTHSEIPWSGIIGQRHVLAHEYGEILVERIWLVVTERIPELIALVEPLIPTPPQSDA